MWDVYSNQSGDVGQPIATPPVVSIDNLGQPVVLFSTGDQEQLGVSSARNYMYSLLETPNGASFVAKENFHLDMLDGERVTGPISLFASTAYFSSFHPQSAMAVGNVCTYGSGNLWGVDYKTGDGRLDPLNVNTKSQSFGPNTIVFGVAVTQTPSCADSTNFSSSYFGSYTGLSGGSPGDFQLVYQVSGQPAPAQPNSSSVFQTKTLPAPRVTTRIDSWAAIVE